MHPGILTCPLHGDEASGSVRSWLDQPFVNPLVPGIGHWPILRNLLRTTGTSGNLTSDAHLAAMAIDCGATLCAEDQDFKRIPGVDHVNSLDARARLGR